eukprot:CAMPEP_0180692176 /NCGR_PEP_ID=MMETSP1038_2-20121128/676_1 /TAXON_ID=632150 /ORGANISM="Azadinium spinosum, Strain 3D9" /LENGTH=70 /DNA_ID=CAMNT_0022723311 /DNA_START=47 /DNA_END=259 /DNA_ORIENTATION=-
MKAMIIASYALLVDIPLNPFSFVNCFLQYSGASTSWKFAVFVFPLIKTDEDEDVLTLSAEVVFVTVSVPV